MKIGPHIWKIKWVAREFDDEGSLGDCEHEVLTIRVRKTLPSSLMAQTLYHEILHACYPIMDHKDVLDKIREEEDVVEHLSIMMCCVWVDNPNVIKWIASNLGVNI